MSNLIVITVPADGLAPNGARASTGTVMIKFKFHLYMRLALEGLVKRLRQNGWHFVDDIFIFILLYEQFCILIQPEICPLGIN